MPPPSVSTLALVHLYQSVSAFMTADGVPAVNMFGWRIPAQHPYGNRLAWVPGDLSGKFGDVGPPRGPGGFPRSLATVHELFTVVINGQDPDDPENEIKQYGIVRLLRDAWHRAVYRTAYGVFTILDEEWDRKRNERRHGATLEIVCTIDASVPDVPWNGVPPWVEVPPPLSGEFGVSLLDVTDTLELSTGVVETVTYLGDDVTYLGELVTVVT